MVNLFLLIKPYKPSGSGLEFRNFLILLHSDVCKLFERERYSLLNSRISKVSPQMAKNSIIEHNKVLTEIWAPSYHYNSLPWFHLSSSQQ